MNALTFDGHQFDLIEKDGRMWLRAADIAGALGYTRTDKLSRLYDRHAAEFTTSMSCLFETPTLGHGNLVTEIRLFSLRGAHLIGMFSRTANGQRFRKWVLDQLEMLDAQASPKKSLMAEWYEAKADLHAQNKFASYCGKGLSEHKKVKPPLLERIGLISEKIQPSLAFA